RRRSARREPACLARFNAAGRGCGLVRAVVGPVERHRHAPAGAAQRGPPVSGAGRILPAQGGAIRAGAPAGYRRTPPGTGPAELPGGGRAERDQGNPAASPRQSPGRPPDQPLPETVLSCPGPARAGQLLALPLSGPGRGLLPQRRTVPLSAPVEVAG